MDTTFAFPEITTCFTFFKRKRAFRGSRIIRFVKNSCGIFHHHGIILGHDKFGTLWIIENSNDGVRCVSMHDFMQGMKLYRIFHRSFPMDKDILLTRVQERIAIPFETRTNNCEIFVNYCLEGKAESVQTKGYHPLTPTNLASRQGQNPSADIVELVFPGQSG